MFCIRYSLLKRQKLFGRLNTFIVYDIIVRDRLCRDSRNLTNYAGKLARTMITVVTNIEKYSTPM